MREIVSGCQPFRVVGGEVRYDERVADGKIILEEAGCESFVDPEKVMLLFG